jgi:hypothetical protein
MAIANKDGDREAELEAAIKKVSPSTMAADPEISLAWVRVIEPEIANAIAPLKAVALFTPRRKCGYLSSALFLTKLSMTPHNSVGRAGLRTNGFCAKCGGRSIGS